MVWLPIEELNNLDWAEADWPVIEVYQMQLVLTPELRPKKRRAVFHREKDR